jgi:hypothetical protein
MSPDLRSQTQHQIDLLDFKRKVNPQNNNVWKPPETLTYESTPRQLAEAKEPLLVGPEKLTRGQQVLQSISSKKFWLQLINVPKTLVTMGDISAPFNQGGKLVGRKEWWQSWKPMFKAMANEDTAKEINYALTHDADFAWSQTSKDAQRRLTLTDMAPGAKISAQEEVWLGSIINKVPVLGTISRASERAYVTFLNVLRWNVWHNEFLRMKEGGMATRELGEHAEAFADAVNKLTGRGNIGGLAKSDAAVSVLNAFFFSPRNVVSQIQAPLAVITKDAVVRKIVARDLAKFYGSAAAVLGLAAIAGAKVELDPRSSDFGKAKIGNTRYNVLGGQQQVIRYLAQVATGQRKSASGQIESINRLDTATRFFQSKEAPMTGLVTALLDNKTFTGEPLKPGSQAISMLTPLFWQDLHDAMVDEGIIKGAIMGSPSVAGLFTQTYSPQYNAWMAKYPETARLGISYGQVAKSFTIAGQEVKWTDTELIALQDVTNRLAEQQVAKILASPVFQDADDDVKKKVLESVLSNVREEARNSVLRLLPQGEIQRRVLEGKVKTTKSSIPTQAVAAMPLQTAVAVRQSQQLEQTNPKAAKALMFADPSILQARKQIALAQLAARG